MSGPDKQNGPEGGLSVSPGTYAITREPESDVAIIREVGMAYPVTIDGDFLLEKFTIMGAVEDVCHPALPVCLCVRMTVATVAHSFVKLVIEEIRDELGNQGDISVCLHRLPVSTIAWPPTTGALLQFRVWPCERCTGLHAAVVALRHQLGEFFKPPPHPVK